MENLCFCLPESGDAVLLSTPYYAAFEFDLVARTASNIMPVNTMEYNAPPSTCVALIARLHHINSSNNNGICTVNVMMV